MGSAVMFVVGVVVLALLLLLYAFRSPKAAAAFFKTKDGKGVLKGIVLFIVFGLLIAGASTLVQAGEPEEGEWFAYGEVFLGVDHTKSISPQCDAGWPNDRLTSNGGFRANVYQSADERFEFNTKYTHHSCAFSPDRESYDAIGIELTYRIW